MSTESSTISAPLLSVNEPEAQVVEVLVKFGQKIGKGDLLCVLATTKASFDVEAEASGFIRRILITPGQLIAAGEPIFEIGPDPPAPEDNVASRNASLFTDRLPEGLRITHKALALAGQLCVDLDTLPRDVLITEAVVRSLAPAREPRVTSCSVPDVVAPFDANTVLVYGAGGHAKTVIDLLRQSGQFSLAGLIADPAPTENDLLGAPILGDSGALVELHARGLRLIVNGVGSIDRPRMRVDIFDRLARKGYAFPTIIHSKSVVEPSARVAAGAQVFGSAFVGAAATVGFGAIINTGAIVSHDCKVGDYAHLTPGVILAGRVRIATGALVGMGVKVNVGVTIGEWARIGNGCCINSDVPPHTIVRAGTTWPS